MVQKPWICFSSPSLESCLTRKGHAACKLKQILEWIVQLWGILYKKSNCMVFVKKSTPVCKACCSFSTVRSRVMSSICLCRFSIVELMADSAQNYRNKKTRWTLTILSCRSHWFYIQLVNMKSYLFCHFFSSSSAGVSSVPTREGRAPSKVL